MRSPSSTFNFKRLPFAALTAVLVIFAVEARVSSRLQDVYFNHEVDRVLHEVRTRRFDGSHVVLSDSVGGQLVAAAGGLPNSCVRLTTNQAIETIGQYHLIRRYLERNRPPEAVLYVAAAPLSGNLSQIYTENFFQRCFVEWTEIAEASVYLLNPPFTLKMLAYKLLPSFRYRLHLQEEWLGSVNTPLYTGLEDPERTEAEFWNSFFRKAPYGVTLLTGRRSLNEIYLERMIRLLKKRGVRLYFVQAPVSRSRAATRLFRKYHRPDFIRSLERRYDTFRALTPRGWVLEDKLFKRDGHHLREKYLPDVAAAYGRIFTRLTAPND